MAQLQLMGLGFCGVLAIMWFWLGGGGEGEILLL